MLDAPSQPATSPPPELRASLARWPWWVIGWCGLIALAACFDKPVAHYLRDCGFAGWLKGSFLADRILKPPGVYWMALLSAGLVLVLRQHHRVAGALIVILSGWSGIANALVKWLVGRPRPFWSFVENRRLDTAQPFEFSPMEWARLIKATNLSFPSGHACMAFSTAAALAVAFPRWRWAFYAVATLTALERVGENAHYLSDSVAAAGLGILCVQVMVAGWRHQFLAVGDVIEQRLLRPK